ncbi:hypothetical protein [Nocardia thailandica]|uniref:hypothetical protein n=1 Tax=Nocardia thailandica TaxID=257275 RepID=UPI0002D605D6|nr:hypothetical protein [Nocardia thailandica]
MGDDRHGQPPQPGGRAPWERYPGTEPEHDEPTGGRRARRAEADSAPLTVQDLVDRVDSERTRRGRRAADAEAVGEHPRTRRRARETAPRPTARRT